MENHLNQQHTLFKFVSIRPPQLADPENENPRFIKNITFEESKYPEALVGKAPDKTKREWPKRV